MSSPSPPPPSLLLTPNFSPPPFTTPIIQSSSLFLLHPYFPHSLFLSVFTLSLLIAGQFYFTKDHEWVTVDAKNVATVGITDHAQHALGDVVYVDIPEKGKVVKQKGTLAAVESVKAASGIYIYLFHLIGIR
jgi:hypothetical protein